MDNLFGSDSDDELESVTIVPEDIKPTPHATPSKKTSSPSSTDGHEKPKTEPASRAPDATATAKAPDHNGSLEAIFMQRLAQIDSALIAHNISDERPERLTKNAEEQCARCTGTRKGPTDNGTERALVDIASPILQHQLAEMQQPPFPSLALSHALIFADPSARVLKNLAALSEVWSEAVVLSTPCWEPTAGKLTSPIDLRDGMSPLATASFWFDPDRELILKDFVLPDTALSEECAVLGVLRRLKVSSSVMIPETLLSTLCQAMPSLTSIQLLTSVDGIGGLASLSSTLRELEMNNCAHIHDLTPLASLSGLEALHLKDCASVKDVSPISQLRNLRSLALTGCHALSDLADVERLLFHPEGLERF